eukprot:11054680-Ditylum_brightwellii.AAC.1
MDKYVGCKVNRDWSARDTKLTQLVLLQSYDNKFKLDEHMFTPTTPAELGTVLSKGKGILFERPKLKKYCTSVSKLLHMTHWTYPEIQNAVRE